MRRAAAIYVFIALVCGFLLLAEANGSAPQLSTGAQIYTSACAACHGADGRGAPKALAGFEQPETFPDFTRCDQTTSEVNSAYQAIVTYGGPYRGFSQIMPAFGKALSPKQVEQVVHYIREFCTDSRWPRGELNLPRAFQTEKAYPEDEEVLTTAVVARGAPGVEAHIIHEQRFGMKNQLEVDVPLMFQHPEQTWYGGIGDVTIGWKRVLYSSLPKGSIFAVQGEVNAPTGNYNHDLGAGTTTIGVFGMYDQLFKSNTFVQLQSGTEIPVDGSKDPRTVYGYAAFGQTFAQDHGFGREWSPMVEFLANHDLMSGAKVDWDVLPQMQVTLSKRQHIRADLGVRVPVTDTANRPIRLQLYVLWDWADGKLTEGW